MHNDTRRFGQVGRRPTRPWERQRGRSPTPGAVCPECGDVASPAGRKGRVGGTHLRDEQRRGVHLGGRRFELAFVVDPCPCPWTAHMVTKNTSRYHSLDGARTRLLRFPSQFATRRQERIGLSAERGTAQKRNKRTSRTRSANSRSVQSLIRI